MPAADAPTRIRHWLGRGLKGLRVFIAGHTTAAGHAARRSRPVSAWRCAVDAGLPVCVQLRTPNLPQLETLLEEFPSARVILDHMARPAPDDAGSLFSLARYSNLFLKFTTHNVRDAAKAGTRPEAFMRRVVDAFGARRIAWGSNYPASEGSLGSLLADARQTVSVLSADDQEWIFSRTANSLY
jgi:predicted TIM-barrel fold metal-dependent hydrolase